MVKEPLLPPVCTVLPAQLTATHNDLQSADEGRLDTARIQTALDTCGKGHGVELGSHAKHDAFLSGPLQMREGVSLIVDRGVTLFASRDAALYDIVPGGCGVSGPAARGCRPLIGVHDVHNAAIIGEGVIDGRGGDSVLGKPYSWWQQSRDAQPENLKYSAPRLIVADHADGLILYRIRLHNSPNFHVTVSHTNGFTAWDVHILTPTVAGPEARNTDGIDPSESENLTITKSWISDGDDNVAIKKGVHSMSVLDNHFYVGHGMSIGSEASDEKDIFVDTLTLDHTSSGIRLKSNVQKGGLTSHLVYRNICMRNVAAPISVSPFYTGRTRDGIEDNGMKGSMIPDFKGILLQNVISETPGLVSVGGYDMAHRTEMTLDGVQIKGIEPAQVQARNAHFTIGPAGTNLHFSGEDVTVSGNSPFHTGFSCKEVFVPYSE